MDELDFGATVRGFSVNQKVFGRYTLKKILGRGGMGVVWLVRDDELEHEIAMKFLPEMVSADKEAVRDLKRETRRSLELTHPHIVRIYDFVQDDRAVAIAMEYIAGDTLASRKVDQAKGFFEVRELEAWVKNALDALNYAHTKAQIVHRDLKPANLMIDGAGDLKIADFGIAASVSDSVSRVSARVGSSGTPVYMSPQQMMGEKPAVTDDIYSLGATLFELLTGKPPFYAGNVLRQVEIKVPPLMSERRKELGVQGDEIPAAWDQAVAACLAKEPKDRPQTVAELAARLGLGSVTTSSATAPETAKAKSTIAAPPIPQRERTPSSEPSAMPTKPRKSGMLLVVLAVVVVALAGAGYYFGVRVPKQKRHDEIARAEAKARADAETLAAARGGINVKTEPSAAEVTVGDLAPGPSPFASKNLPLGPITVTAHLADYEEGKETVEVKKDEEANVLIKLRHSTGALQINSDPAGIAYYLFGPGTNRQGITPATEKSLPTGPYKVVYRRRGWPDQTKTLDVRREDTVTANAEFAPGMVRIGSEPEGATVYAANGRKIGSTPMSIPEVPTGTAEYTLTLEGYQTKQIRGEVLPKKALELTALLTKVDRPQQPPPPSEPLAREVPAEPEPSVSAVVPTTGAGRSTPEMGQRWTIPDLALEMIPLQPGTIVMMYTDFVPVHNASPREVRLTKQYWLGKTEVTLGQWKQFAEPTHFKSKSEDGSGLDAYLNNKWVKLPDTSWRNPRFPTSEQGDDSPVVGLSWDEVHQFITWLNQRERAAKRLPNGYEYSLPTEAQWEFAAHGAPSDRAAPTPEAGWFLENGNYTTHPVASLKPNSRGFYDIYGNTWEWCQDFYDGNLPGGKFTDAAVTSAVGIPLHVVRGASWTDVRGSYNLRIGIVPILRAANTGFRLALVPMR